MSDKKDNQQQESRQQALDRRAFIKGALLASSAAGIGLAPAGAALGASKASASADGPRKGMGRRSSAAALRERLGEYLAGLEIIDAHEHLPCEPVRVAKKVDALTLCAQYIYVDTISAGYKPAPGEGLFAYNYFLDDKVPFEQRWAKAWPHLQYVKHGSYFRAAKIALKEFYGIDDLNEKTCQLATERMRAANTKGLYKRVLADKCRIRACLVQNGMIKGQDPAELFIPVMNASLQAIGFFTPGFRDTLSRMYATPIEDLDAYLDGVRRLMKESREQGAVGVKIGAEPNVTPDLNAARQAFKDWRAGQPASVVLKSTVLDAILRQAGEWDWPVAVHTGVWNDFRQNESRHVIDLVMRHPKVRFDLYHLGFPNTRDFIFIVKNFPNAHANLCWAYLVSPEMTRQAIGELLDAVPVNKVTAFGGDYAMNVENVYGHLVMARETLAEAFAERVARGLLDEEAARMILKMWLHDNPVRLYGLKLS